MKILIFLSCAVVLVCGDSLDEYKVSDNNDDFNGGNFVSFDELDSSFTANGRRSGSDSLRFGSAGGLGALRSLAKLRNVLGDEDGFESSRGAIGGRDFLREGVFSSQGGRDVLREGGFSSQGGHDFLREGGFSSQGGRFLRGDAFSSHDGHGLLGGSGISSRRGVAGGIRRFAGGRGRLGSRLGLRRRLLGRPLTINDGGNTIIDGPLARGGSAFYDGRSITPKVLDISGDGSNFLGSHTADNLGLFNVDNLFVQFRDAVDFGHSFEDQEFYFGHGRGHKGHGKHKKSHKKEDDYGHDDKYEKYDHHEDEDDHEEDDHDEDDHEEDDHDEDDHEEDDHDEDDHEEDDHHEDEDENKEDDHHDEKKKYKKSKKKSKKSNKKKSHKKSHGHEDEHDYHEDDYPSVFYPKHDYHHGRHGRRYNPLPVMDSTLRRSRPFTSLVPLRHLVGRRPSHMMRSYDRHVSPTLFMDRRVLVVDRPRYGLYDTVEKFY